MTTTTLVLVPGLGSDDAVWHRTIAVLDGRVSCIIGDTLSDANLAGMARTILDHAPERFALAGVSMGGMVALEMMRAAPHRVSHLALVDTSARPDTVRQRLWRRVSNAVVRAVPDFRSLAARSVPSLVHTNAPADLREELVAMSARVGAAIYRRQNRAVASRVDLRPVLPTIAVPTAVIVGEEDRLIPVARSREIQALVPGATLHVLPGCGHLPPIEQPGTMAHLLLALLRSS